jgi:hypothetical protein
MGCARRDILDYLEVFFDGTNSPAALAAGL